MSANETAEVRWRVWCPAIEVERAGAWIRGHDCIEAALQYANRYSLVGLQGVELAVRAADGGPVHRVRVRLEATVVDEQDGGGAA